MSKQIDRSIIKNHQGREGNIVLFCELDDATPVRLNDGVSIRIRIVYANYLRLIVQFI